MVRTHTLVEYRLKEFELEQALRRLKKQQESLDYKLDVEFYLKLEALAKGYGYSLGQVYDLLVARYEGEGCGLELDADGLRARTNNGLLEMIQRMDTSSSSAQLANNSALLSLGGGVGEALKSDAGLSPHIHHASKDPAEVGESKDDLEEKIYD